MAVEALLPAAGLGRRARFSHRRLWLSLYDRDPRGAEHFVDRVMQDWCPPRIYLRLFEPALSLNGTLAARNKIAPADAQYVTHQTVRLMRRVRRLSPFARPGAYRQSGPLALVTAIEQDSHQVGLRMVCDFLGWSNWRVCWLASNDRATVGGAVSRQAPDALLLSLGNEAALARAARLIADLRRRNFRGLVIVGGMIVNAQPDRAARIGADLTAPNGPGLVRALRPKFPQMRRPVFPPARLI